MGASVRGMLGAPEKYLALAIAADSSPGDDELLKIVAAALNECLVVDLVGKPFSRRVLKYASADGEAAAGTAISCFFKGCDQLIDRGAEAEHQDATTVGVSFLDQLIDLLPLFGGWRWQLPPVRVNAEIVEARHRPDRRVFLKWQTFGGYELEEEFVAAFVGCFAQGPDLAFLRQPPVKVVVRVVVNKALDDLFNRYADSTIGITHSSSETPRLSSVLKTWRCRRSGVTSKRDGATPPVWRCHASHCDNPGLGPTPAKRACCNASA